MTLHNLCIKQTGKQPASETKGSSGVNRNINLLTRVEGERMVHTDGKLGADLYMSLNCLLSTNATMKLPNCDTANVYR